MEDVKRIAVVQGAASEVVQDLLRRFLARLGPEVRVAGVIEDPVSGEEGPCSGGDLRSLADGRRFPLMQDLGPAAEACRLDAAGVVGAAEAVTQGIAAGCDLVVLNKFGKIEAERSGLAPAFACAIEAGLPILTSVSPRFTGAWDRYAAPLYVILPPELDALDGWWRAVASVAGARPGGQTLQVLDSAR
jgi:hypothetical protein